MHANESSAQEEMNFPSGSTDDDGPRMMDMMQLAALITIIHEKHGAAIKEEEENGDDGDKKIPAQDDKVLAQSLQREEWNHCDDQFDAVASLAALCLGPKESKDASLAATLHQEEQRNKTNEDQKLAATLFKEEQRKNVEEYAMHQSVDGRAWLFVNQVVDLDMRLWTCASSSGLTTVAVDDMVFLGKNFIACADEFQANGWPSRVILAYHYTRNQHLDSIRQDGLMTRADRQRTYSSGTTATSTDRAGFFGDGVYTATNPFAFRHFGDVGLLVAVLLGNTTRVSCRYRASSLANLGGSINTVIGNKRHLNSNISEEDKFSDELVLQESRQCLPLMRFNSALVSSEAGRDAVWKYHQDLQNLIDRVFNGGVATELKRILPPTSNRVACMPVAAAVARVPVAASVARPSNNSPAPKVLTYTAPQNIITSTPMGTFEKGNDESQEDCVICMDSLCNSGTVVRLRQCGHEYHKTCIKDSLKTSSACPVCRTLIRKPQGLSPSGTMTITTTPIPCSGFESCGGSIVVRYTMPSGIQMPYHENPGEPYQGVTRVAYLPDNEDGRKLLQRLKNAWMRGLTFTIGTSMTTGRPNCITWASIHHKTSPSGGVHGFLDPGFFVNCNSELDSLGVPK